MERRFDIGVVRQRPGMYVGNTDDGSGVLNVLLELLSNAVDQHLAGRCRTASITIDADETITIADDGPGLPVDGSDRLPPIEELLTTLSLKPTVDGHRPHVHLASGVGIAVCNAVSERFTLVTVRDGRSTTITCARGEVVAPRVTTPSPAPTGTTITFRPDPLVFQQLHVPRHTLAERLHELSFLVPGLAVRCSMGPDPIARRGLAGLVAARTPCDPAQVAHRRESTSIESGPLDLEVALAWRRSYEPDQEPRIEAFANLGRNRDGGSHTQGLHLGLKRFVGVERHEACKRGLVAAVAVVLADVHYGSPSQDKLVTPAVCEPVAVATLRALEAWAEACPEAAQALRARKPVRRRR